VSKKRTRKEKTNPKHSFLISWSEASNQASPRTVVNRQTKNKDAGIKTKSIGDNNAYLLDKDTDLTSIKRGIIKSLILTGLILATEVVLYFLWS
jgi:hypothetical protein